jgi:hypothetical protein
MPIIISPRSPAWAGLLAAHDPEKCEAVFG